MTQWLTPAEVCEVTGYVRPSAQIRWIEARDIPYMVSGNGRPIVFRETTLPANYFAPQQPTYAKASGPWTDEGVPPYIWRERNRHILEANLNEIDGGFSEYAAGDGPRIHGVYFLRWQKTLTYVGRSACIANRLLQHFEQRRIPFDSFAHIPVPPLIIEDVELFHIQRHRPPYNVRGVL